MVPAFCDGGAARSDAGPTQCDGIRCAAEDGAVEMLVVVALGR